MEEYIGTVIKVGGIITTSFLFRSISKSEVS